MTPLVLHHGLFGHGDWQLGPLKWRYFNQIDEKIAARGYPIIIPGVHPTAGVTTRARQLKQIILARLAEMNRRDKQVVIIAHSLGGLDARYMITHLGMASQVKALVTVCSPHRGTPYADWCAHNVGRRLGGFQLMKFLGLDVQAFLDTTRPACKVFNTETPDQPGVKYFSVSAQRPEKMMPPFARHSHRLISAAEGANDGLVSVKSAQWGEHLATWPLDHWLTINRRLVPHAQRSVRIVAYWLKVVDRLVEDGLLEKGKA